MMVFPAAKKKRLTCMSKNHAELPLVKTQTLVPEKVNIIMHTDTHANT